MSNRASVTAILEQISLRCSIYPYEIVRAERRHSDSDRSAPLFIQCIDKNVKWKLIVQINKLRAEEDFKNTYARPYLNEEELKLDRAMVRKLTHFRTKYAARSFKIRRGIIYEIDQDSEIIFEEEEEAEIHEREVTEEPAPTEEEPIPAVTGTVPQELQTEGQQPEGDNDATQKDHDETE